MGKLLGIWFTEGTRLGLCSFLSAANWMSIIVSLGLVCLGIYVKFYIEEYTNLVENYDDSTFPYMLVGIGAFALLLNIGSGFLFYAATDPEKREIIRHFLTVCMVLQTLLAIAFLVAGIMCFMHIRHLEESFKDGFYAAMRRYSTELHVKIETDLMQSEYMCCGNDRYTDWFLIDWIPPEYKKEFSYKEEKKVKAKRIEVDTGVTQ